MLELRMGGPSFAYDIVPSKFLYYGSCQDKEIDLDPRVTQEQKRAFEARAQAYDDMTAQCQDKSALDKRLCLIVADEYFECLQMGNPKRGCDLDATERTSYLLHCLQTTTNSLECCLDPWNKDNLCLEM